MTSAINRFKGALMGLAIGDALGAPYEFRIPAESIKNFKEGGKHKIKKGEWTDDTAMALCLAQSIIEKKGFSILDQMSKFKEWLFHGYMSTREYAVGSGSSTRDAITKFSGTGDPYAGSNDPNKAGNGSIMRLAPVPLVFNNDIVLASKLSAECSKSTHRCPECIESCMLLGEMIAKCFSAKNKADLINNWIGKFTEPKIKEILTWDFLKEKELNPQGAYVIDTLKLALHSFFNTDSFEEAIIKAVNTPGDRDTFGAVTGQIAGAYYGIKAIPKIWQEELMKKDFIIDTAKQLYEISKNQNLTIYDSEKKMKGPFVGISIVVIRDDMILVGKRKGSHGEGTWGLPRGYLEAGETWEQCAQRELKKETGIEISTDNFYHINTINVRFYEEFKHYIDICLICVCPEKTKAEIKEPDKYSEWIWYELDKAAALTPKFKPFEKHFNKIVTYFYKRK